MQRISIFFIILFSLFSIALSGQTMWYVSPNGSGTQSGANWANAKSLQNAVTNLNYGQTELRLRQGNYPVSTTITIGWGYNVRFIGGYSGTGTTRNYALYPTNLNGQHTTQIMNIQEDNCSIDGVNFINAFVTGEANGGAGLIVRANTFQIRNSNFRNNISEGASGAGALYLSNGYQGAILIENCIFENNRSNHKVYPMGDTGGGALHNRADNVTIKNSVFRNNYAENLAGAILAWGKNFQIEDTRFENNTSELRGGGIFLNYYDLSLKNTQFINNKADEGGGIYLSHIALNIQNSLFTGNEARVGGGIATNNGQWNSINTIFRNNKATEKGGAIYNHRFSEISTIEKSEFYDNIAAEGGALYNLSDNGLKVFNSLFHKNIANNKGGAIFNSRNIEIANSTFVGNTNTALIIPSYPKSQFNPFSTSIFNSIFYQNTAKTGGFRADIHPEIVNQDDSDKDIRRNIVQSYNLGTGNLIGVNPQFVNNTNNFRLQTTSPAVNYGINALYNQVSPTVAGSSTDLANLPRLIGSSIDLGAYELQPVVLACPAMTLPTPNATNVPIGTNISWNAIANATGYRISIGTTPGGTNIRNNFNVGNVTTYNHPTDLASGTTYYVRITPYNSISSTANCTEYRFSTATPTVASPTCSTITSPTNNATNVSVNPTITWSASSGATGYRIRVGTTAGGSDILSQNLGNVTSFTLPTNLNYSTNYFVRIIPFNSAGDASGCVEHRFTTESQPITVPTCSTITSPTNNATNVSLTPTITWNSVPNVTGYRITIGTTPTNSDIINNQDVGNLTSYTLTTSLAQNTQYYIRIIPYNSVGSASGCTQTSFRTLTTPTVPNCTTIISPANNATNISLTPTITWSASSGATGYRIRVGTTAGGSDILSQNLGNVTSFALPTNLNYNSTYFVRIIPFNSAGDASGCAEHRFTTVSAPITAPSCSTITFPTNNASNIAINPTITWTASSNATGYRIRVGTTAGGSDILSQNLGNVTSFALPTSLNYSTAYFVRIIPFNSAGDASGCVEHRFTTESQIIQEFKIPNVFTPNGDGINDTIDFSELLNQNDLKIKIFDRYGKVHFEGNQTNHFVWDGSHYGKKSSTGTYWYMIEWTDALGEKHLEKGWILLKSR